jgi:hypothetical protein
MVRLTATFRAEQVRRYVEPTYRMDDRVAATLIPPDRSAAILERFARADWLVRDETLRFLAAQNARGCGVYVAPNPLADGARSRTKQTVREASSVWLDLDDGADQTLERLSAELPPATTITRTSPGKYQVLWRLEAPVDVAEGERILRGLAAAYNGDRAATDACRLLRLPGFVNTKYPALPLSRRIVEVVGGTAAAVSIDGFGRVADYAVDHRPQRTAQRRAEGAIERPAAAPVEIDGDNELVRLWSGLGRTAWGQDKTASERDLALAHGLRRREVEVQRAIEILRTSPNRVGGRLKSNMDDYLARTLRRAGYPLRVP